MQLAAVDKAKNALEVDKQAIAEAMEMLVSTKGAWEKLIARTNALVKRDA